MLQNVKQRNYYLKGMSMRKYNKGQLVVYRNAKKDEIVLIVTESGTEGIVIHSDNLVSQGTTLTIDDSYEPYVGTITISVNADDVEPPKEIGEGVVIQQPEQQEQLLP